MANWTTIIDNFNDNSLDTGTWNAGGTGGAETNRQYRITAASGGTNFSDLITDIAHSIDEQASFVELVQADIAVNTLLAGFLLEVATNGDNQIMIFVDGSTNNLTFRKRNSGSNNDTSIAYDAVAHRWLRIREAGGTIFMDTSPDGINWTNRRNFANDYGTTDFFGGVFGGVTGNEASPTTIIFDNVNFVLNRLPSTSESITITESVNRLLTSNISRSDTITLTESVSISVQSPVVGTLSISVSDSITITESITTRTDLNIVISEGIDQQNPTGGVGIGFGDTGMGRDYLVQGFIPTETSISAIAFNVSGKSGSANQGYKAWIDTADANSVPTNGINGIGGATEITNAQIVTGSLTKYNLASPVSLIPGNQYVLVLAPWNTTTHIWSQDYQDFVSTTTNAYANGRRVHLDGSYANPTAPDAGNADILFRTYASKETISVSESVNRLLTSNISSSESITISEQTSVLIPSLSVTAQDTITATESIKLELTSFITKSEVITVQDTPEIEPLTIPDADITTSDNVTVAEVVQVTIETNVQVSENITITEASTVFIPELFIVQSESISIADTATIAPPLLQINVLEQVQVTEATSFNVAGHTYTLTKSENVTVTDVPNVAHVLQIRATADTITVTESIEMNPPHKPSFEGRLVIDEEGNPYWVVRRDARIPTIIKL